MNKFRTKFDYSKLSKEIYQWFPGHMQKGLKQIYEHLPNVDAIIEVHDARVPFTGRNFHFRQSIVGNKPYCLVLNKADLGDLTHKNKIVDKLAQSGYSPVFFTTLKNTNDKTTKKILPEIINQIENKFRFNRELIAYFHLLVIGVPNVGKSTLINRLRNFHLKQSNAVRVGAEPGITRSLTSKVKINQNPLVYVYDTPGVLEPTFKEIETGLKLALLNCVKNHQVNAGILADYLLFKLNKAQVFKYVEYYKLNEPSDDIFEVLIHIAKLRKIYKIHKGFDYTVKKMYDIDAVSHMMIYDFFNGNLGKLLLDSEILDEENGEINLNKFV